MPASGTARARNRSGTFSGHAPRQSFRRHAFRHTTRKLALNRQPAGPFPTAPGSPPKGLRRFLSNRRSGNVPERNAPRLLFHRPGPGFQQPLRMLRALRPYRNRTPASLRPPGPPPATRPNRLRAGPFPAAPGQTRTDCQPASFRTSRELAPKRTIRRRPSGPRDRPPATAPGTAPRRPARTDQLPTRCDRSEEPDEPPKQPPRMRANSYSTAKINTSF